MSVFFLSFLVMSIHRPSIHQMDMESSSSSSSWSSDISCYSEPLPEVDRLNERMKFSDVYSDSDSENAEQQQQQRRLGQEQQNVRAEEYFEGDDCCDSDEAVKFKYLKNIEDLGVIDVDSIVCVCERLSDFRKCDRLIINTDIDVLKTCTNNKILQTIRSKYPKFENQRDVFEVQLQVGSMFDNIYILIRNFSCIAEIDEYHRTTKACKFFNIFRNAFRRLKGGSKTRRLNTDLGKRIVLYGDDWEEYSDLLNEEFRINSSIPFDRTPQVLYYKCQHGLKSKNIHRVLLQLNDACEDNRKPLFTQIHMGITYNMKNQVVLCCFQNLLKFLGISTMGEFRGNLYRKFSIRNYGHFANVRQIEQHRLLGGSVIYMQMYDEESHKLREITQKFPMSIISRLFCGDLEVLNSTTVRKPPVFDSGDIRQVPLAILDYLNTAKSNGLTGRVEFVFVDVLNYNRCRRLVEDIQRLLQQYRVLVVSSGDSWKSWIDKRGIRILDIFYQKYFNSYLLSSSPRPFTMTCKEISYAFHLLNCLIRFVEANFDRYYVGMYRQFSSNPNKSDDNTLSCDQFHYILSKFSYIGFRQVRLVESIVELYTAVESMPNIDDNFERILTALQCPSVAGCPPMIKKYICRLIMVYNSFAKHYCGLPRSSLRQHVNKESIVFKTIRSIREAAASSSSTCSVKFIGTTDPTRIVESMCCPVTLAGALLSSFAINSTIACDEEFRHYLKLYVTYNFQCFPAQFLHGTNYCRRNVWQEVLSYSSSTSSSSSSSSSSAAAAATPACYSQMNVRMSNLRQFHNSTPSRPIDYNDDDDDIRSAINSLLRLAGSSSREADVASPTTTTTSTTISRTTRPTGRTKNSDDLLLMPPPPRPPSPPPAAPLRLLPSSTSSSSSSCSCCCHCPISRTTVATTDVASSSISIASSSSSSSTNPASISKTPQISSLSVPPVASQTLSSSMKSFAEIIHIIDSDDDDCAPVVKKQKINPFLKETSLSKTSIHPQMSLLSSDHPLSVTSPETLSSSSLSISEIIHITDSDDDDDDAAAADEMPSSSSSTVPASRSPFYFSTWTNEVSQEDHENDDEVRLGRKLVEIKNKQFGSVDIPKSGHYSTTQLKFVLFTLVLRCQGMSRKAALEKIIREGGRTVLPGRTVHSLKTALYHFRKNPMWVEHQLEYIPKYVQYMRKYFS